MAVFTPGMRVECRNAEWLVTRVEAASSKGDQIVFCVGADDFTRGHEAAFLTQLDIIKEIDPKLTKLVRDESNGYMVSKLFIEAQLRQMPLTDPDPHVEGMGAFKPMKYQKEAVQKALSQIRPRLLLADAVGLGKTIEVGMILSELMKRGQAERILVLAKKSMLAQFQSELWNRFSLPLIRMDSAALQKLQLKIPASKNPFEVYKRIIISIDTLKDIGRYSHFLENTRWDVVVIDEAHNVAGGSNPEKHLSYRLARRLSRRSNSMILTTATPHNGKRETFGRLISLLDPSAIPDPELKKYEAKDISPFFLMRFKEDVRAEAGDNFANRIVVDLKDTTYPASADEEVVYAKLAELRQAVKNKTVEAEAIVQWGMYKSFLSSPEACLSTANKRLAALKKSDPDNPEIDLLKPLIKQLTPITIDKSARFQLLLKQLDQIRWNGKAESPRLLIFTESRVTQQALSAALAKVFKLSYRDKQESQPDQVIATIHGGMSDVALAKTVESFGTGTSPIRMMIATEVASEGVNLHHQCHNIIHYDLPWSIITLIQRNGRVDRFGQKHNPVIRYLMVDTAEGLLSGDKDIFNRLVEKVEEINRSTRTGESVLKLYSAEKEEEYIATQGVLAGKTDILDKAQPESEESAGLEAMLQQAGQAVPGSLMAMAQAVMAQMAAQTSLPAESSVTDNSRIRLLNNDVFFERGYQTLKDQIGGTDWHPIEKTANQYIFTPPKELARRLGKPGSEKDVILGATAIPEESWPEDDYLYLTHDPLRVNQAIQAAQAQKGQWSRELLLTEQHPVMQWLVERLQMLQPRGEAPLIASPHLEEGQMLFCFIGQVSSKAGTPLLVEPHAVSFRKGGKFDIRPLKEALQEVRFDQLVNSGKQGKLPPSLMSAFVGSAVDQSRQHMGNLKKQRQQLVKPRLDEEEARLKNWFAEWAGHIDRSLSHLPPEGKRATRLRQKREEMEKYMEDRLHTWQQTYYEASDEPLTRLVMVIEGVK